jgi:hypothetical protein
MSAEFICVKLLHCSFEFNNVIEVINEKYSKLCLRQGLNLVKIQSFSRFLEMMRYLIM